MMRKRREKEVTHSACASFFCKSCPYAPMLLQIASILKGSLDSSRAFFQVPSPSMDALRGDEAILESGVTMLSRVEVYNDMLVYPAAVFDVVHIAVVYSGSRTVCPTGQPPVSRLESPGTFNHSYDILSHMLAWIIICCMLTIMPCNCKICNILTQAGFAKLSSRASLKGSRDSLFREN